MALPAPAAPAPTPAPTFAPGAAPLCECHGCGMPATATTDTLHHCDHHRHWPASKDGKVARTMKGTG